LKATLEARIKAHEEQTRKENRDEEILKTETPKQWMELKAWLKNSIGQLNQGTSELVTYTEEGINAISLRCNAGQSRREMKVELLPVIGGHISVRGHKRHFSFEAEVDGRTVYWSEQGDKPSRLDIEKMGTHILDEAVKV
jgi:hypothetical protein